MLLSYYWPYIYFILFAARMLMPLKEVGPTYLTKYQMCKYSKNGTPKQKGISWQLHFYSSISKANSVCALHTSLALSDSDIFPIRQNSLTLLAVLWELRGFPSSCHLTATEFYRLSITGRHTVHAEWKDQVNKLSGRHTYTVMHLYPTFTPRGPG